MSFLLLRVKWDKSNPRALTLMCPIQCPRPAEPSALDKYPNSYTTKKQNYLMMFHTLQLNFLFSDWFFRNTRSVLKMSTALRVLRTDCARCFWCVITRVNVTSTDPFFHWVNWLIFFMLSGILSHFIYDFHKHKHMILFFCRVWIRLINLHLLLWVK